MVLLAVKGTLMRGLALNDNLTGVGATFVRESRTTPEYKLFSVRDIHPGMMKVPRSPVEEGPGVTGGGGGIELELWDVPEAGLVSILQKEPAGLCVGKVSIVGASSSDVKEVLGVLAEPWAVKGMRDITQYGGWRAYKDGKRTSEQVKESEPVEIGRPTARPVSAVSSSLGWLRDSIGRGPKGPGQVRSAPYNWPFDGDLTKENTVLLIIDMQVDFCGKGGYVDQMGYDISLTAAPIEPIRKLLHSCRSSGVRVIHTREGHRPDLSDLPANKKWRSEQIGAGIGCQGPMGRVLVRGERGWDIVPELSPVPGEPVVDKPGKGSFFATDLELLLRGMKAKNLLLTGITTDVCVHTTMRVANDMGYECLLLADCTGATDPGNYEAALKMVTMQGGVFGAVSFSTHVIDILSKLD